MCTNAHRDSCGLIPLVKSLVACVRAWVWGWGWTDRGMANFVMYPPSLWGECNVCEALICKLVYLFIVFGDRGRYIGNISHLW